MAFWMALYGADTAKRHYMFANTAVVSRLDKGKLVKGKFKCKVATARKYKNKDNKDCYAGTRHLRATEYLASMNLLGRFLVCGFLAPRLRGSARIYPVAFAKTFASLYPEMKRSCYGQPKLPEVIPAASETFASMSWGTDQDLWSFANLASVFKYLRGGEALNIPVDWRPLVPKRL